jgi:hypothetical protein
VAVATMKLPKRPLTLKLAFAFAVLGLVVGMVVVVLAKDDYGDGWVLIIPARMFVTVAWLVLFILALNGRSWVRYLFGSFVVIGLLSWGYRYPELLGDELIWLVHMPSMLAVVCFFLPQSNAWYKAVEHLAARQGVPADAA